jgi:hypothetical protein
LTSSSASSLQSTPSVHSSSPPRAPGSYDLRGPERVGQLPTTKVRFANVSTATHPVVKIATEDDAESIPAVRARPTTPDKPRITKNGAPISYPESLDQSTSKVASVDGGSTVTGPRSSSTNTLQHQRSSPSGTSSTGPKTLTTPRADPHVVDTSLPLVPSLTTQGVRPCPSHSPYEHRKADEASFAICKVRSELEELKKKTLFFRKPRRDRDLKKVIEDRDFVRFSPFPGCHLTL